MILSRGNNTKFVLVFSVYYVVAAIMMIVSVLQLMVGISSSFQLDRIGVGVGRRRRRRIHQSPLPSLLRLSSALSSNDEEYLMQAVEYAKVGLGHTFPNPAVGCVLVRQDTGEVVGAGFHPRAGFPHAEVFALLEAAGHVEDGVEAAKAIVASGGGGGKSKGNKNDLIQTIEQLTDQYASSSNGPQSLFEDCLQNCGPITAYVTLEPCCHYGKTPPCAASLVLSKASRVVVGLRDPNPRVDGGGVKVLQDAGIDVDQTTDEDNRRTKNACKELVTDFCKRITPRPETQTYDHVNGAARSALRSLAARYKRENQLVQISWGGDKVRIPSLEDSDDSLMEAVDALELEPEWMEHLDGVLWREELVLIRLNSAVAKKKGAKRLGDRIANQLQAHVAQSVGHTVLLYRPGIPPVLDLEQLVINNNNKK